MRVVLPFLIAAQLILASHLHGQDQTSADENPANVESRAEPHLSEMLGQTSIEVRAEKGSGFGVAELVIENPKPALHLRELDAQLDVRSEDCRIWFPAKEKPRATTGSKTKDQLTLYFLFDKGFPKSVDLSLNGKLLKKGIPVENSLGGSTVQNATHRWWSAFCRQSYALAPYELHSANRDLLASLGSHLGGLTPERPANVKSSTSQLEQEFERTIGMLLGFESVRLAMMTDDAILPPRASSSPARMSLPRSLNVAGVRLPTMKGLSSVAVPQITQLVPRDCYLVRCKSLGNYLRLRGMLVDWGGSLDDVIAGNVIDSQIRTRLEEQLALNPNSLLDAGSEALIADLAVIGSDLLFQDGAGVGILFQASNLHAADKLAQIIEEQRNVSGVMLTQAVLNGRPVSCRLESGNRVRSFLVRLQDFILVTNSTHIAKSVIQAQQSRTSLGQLNEFKYALANSQKALQSEVLFYLSDPFFRRIASAPFRIELGRRRAAAADCQRLMAASAIAKATGNGSPSTSSLVSKRFLPEDFGKRCDGSIIELHKKKAVDSLRGEYGTFLPVVDVQVDQCNAFEHNQYAAFSQRYRSEWRVMDPVLAALDFLPAEGEQERLDLEIHITPYARNEYRFLSQYLRSATTSFFSVGEAELMGISANLWNPSQTYDAHLGLLDQKVDFSISEGQVLVDGKATQDLFANDRSFAAVSPPDVEGLKALNGLVESLQNRKAVAVSEPHTPNIANRGLADAPFSILRSILQPEELIVQAGMVAIDGMLKLSAMSNVSQDGSWAIYATEPDMHDRLRNELVVRESIRPADIHAFVGDINQSHIVEYLHAYAYCAARQKSGRVATWLSFWSNGMHDEQTSFLNSVEQLVGGRLTCPLNGGWHFENDGSRWASTAWDEPRVHLVQGVPANYRHPFFKWFQKMDLQFRLNSTSLDSNIVVTYTPSKNHLQNSNSGALIADNQTFNRNDLSSQPLEVNVQDLQPPILPPVQTTKPERTSTLRSKISRLTEIGVRVNPASLVISVIKPGLPASRSRLQVGDRILAVNSRPVSDVEQLRSQILRASRADGVVTLRILRDGQRSTLEVRLDPLEDIDL